MQSGEQSADWRFTSLGQDYEKEKTMADFIGKRRHSPFEDPIDDNHVSYKRFRSRISRASRRRAPAASTPLSTRWWYESSFQFDPVCQRLELDSPPRAQGPEHRGCCDNHQEAALTRGVFCRMAVTPPPVTQHITTDMRRPASRISAEQEFVWRAADGEHDSVQQAGSGGGGHDLQPFAALGEASESLQAMLVMKMAAPSLLNDYYSNLLDCSCNGVVALALGSSVYLWNSETRTLAGHLRPGPQPGPTSDCPARSISCLSFSHDGQSLCFATRRGEIQLWDVEHNKGMRCLPAHSSVVRALSWNQHLLSSGSILGQIHHLDPRVQAPLVGVDTQKEDLCSLQWSPDGDWLACGSTDGSLSVWDSDVAGLKRSRQPIITMKQCSAVKAVGWCPWQRKTIATGGGWRDGELRIWDTDSGTCVTSVDTHSQICSLRWAEKQRYVVTGHGLPLHHISCWTWESSTLSLSRQLTGHSQRVLHLALNSDSTLLFSAAADQRFHIWDMKQSSTSWKTDFEYC